MLLLILSDMPIRRVRNLCKFPNKSGHYALFYCILGRQLFFCRIFFLYLSNNSELKKWFKENHAFAKKLLTYYKIFLMLLSLNQVMDNYVEVEIEGGILTGTANANWNIQDDSFDHALGTEKVVNVVLESIEGIEDALFGSYESDDDIKATPEQIKEAINLIEGNSEEYLSTPDIEDVIEEPDF